MSDTAAATTPSTGTGSSPSPSAPSSGNAHTVSSFRASLRKDTPDNDSSEESPFVKTKRAQEKIQPTSQVSGEVDEPEELEADTSEEFEADEPAETEEEEEEEEDFSWLEGLKPHKQLHGLELAEIVQALAEGKLPDALLGKLKTTLKRGEEEWEDTYENIRKGSMKAHDYTQKTQAFAAERDAFNADKDEFLGMLQTWKGNPEALMHGLERLEFPVLEVAKLMADRHRELDAMTPKERALFEEKQKYQRELDKIKFDQNRQAKTQTDEQVKAEGNKKADFVSTTAKSFFAKSQIPFNQNTFGVFLEKFKVIANSYPPNTPWSAEMVEWAVDDTAEAYKATMGRREKQQVAANPPKPKQVFDSPAREQIAKATAKPKMANRKGAGMTGAEFRKTFLGR